MPQIERLYWLDREIRAGNYPGAKTMVARYGYAPSQAHADKRLLRDLLHAPIGFDRERGGWYYTDRTFVLPSLILTQRETQALRRALLVAREFGDADATKALQLLAESIGEYAPGVRLDSSEFESAAGAIHPSELALLDPELLGDARRAISRRQRVSLRYYSPHNDEETRRIVRPHHLRFWRGEAYLVAWCERKEDFRDFLLSRARIREWGLLPEEETFRREKAFDAAGYFSAAWEARHSEKAVEVKVRFSAYQARWIRERVYHPSQTLEELPGGGVLLRVSVAGTSEIRRWILGYGSDAEVVEPIALREEIKEEIKKLQKIYTLPQE